MAYSEHCIPEDIDWGAILGSLALMRSLQIVELQEPILRCLQSELLEDAAGRNATLQCS